MSLSPAQSNALKERGVWPEFVRIRQSLKELGIPPRHAKRIACRHHPAFEAAILGNDIPPRQQWPDAVALYNEFWVGTEAAEKHGAAAAAGMPVTSVESMPVTIDGEPVPPPHAPTTPAFIEAERGLFASTDGDIVTSIKWVSNMIAVANIRESEAPSSQAWGLLLWARKNRAEFYKSLAKSIVPSKEEQARGHKGEVDESLPLVRALLEEEEANGRAAHDGAAFPDPEPETADQGS